MKFQLGIKSLFLLLTLMISCEGNSQYSCLQNNSTLQELNKSFKTELKTYFKLTRELQSEDYKQYLQGIINQTIPRSFFTKEARVEKLISLKESDVFLLIWRKHSEIKAQSMLEEETIVIEPPRTASGESARKTKDFYALDINNKFFNCLVNKMTAAASKNFFQTIQKANDLSPGIISHGLIELDDFEDPNIQVYIALQFYYDFIFMMNKLQYIEE